jgi:hypothetical protein
MAHDVFIIWAEEDQKRAAMLASALSSLGFSVEWDVGKESHTQQDITDDAVLDNAACVILILSKTSTASQRGLLREMATRAYESGKLLTVMMQKTRVPTDLARGAHIDLVGWRGSVRNIFFTDLVGAIRAKIEGSAEPQRKGPARRLRRRLTWGATIPVIGAVAAFSANVMSIQENVCSAQLLQPSLSDTCGAWGLGNKPTRDEREAWEALPAGDCEALRAHMEAFPKGALHARAAHLISAARLTQVESWEPSDKRLVLSVSRGTKLFSTGDEGRAEAAKRMQRQAEQTCAGMAAASNYKLREAVAEISQTECTQYSEGVGCASQGWALCKGNIRVLTPSEVCIGANG